MHGDEFDVVVRHSKWLAFLGDWAYDFGAVPQHPFQRVRRRLGFGYWSFSAWAKLKVKNAVNFIGAFERELADEARRRGADGVICGHIHHADDPRHRAASPMSTPAISSNPAPLSSSMTTAGSKCCAGRRRAPRSSRGAGEAGRRGAGRGRRSGLMRILLATDAWRPQVNGVVRTLEHMTQRRARRSAPRSSS